MMTANRTQPLPLARFSWTPTRKLLTAELSDLQTTLGPEVQIKSHHTGKTMTFRYTSTDRTPDGEEVAGWRYFCRESGISLLIIND